MTMAIQQKDKKYPITTIAIQNKVTECFKSMSVDEKRLLIMASPIARNIDATEQDSILISADEFAKECGIKVRPSHSNWAFGLGSKVTRRKHHAQSQSVL